MKKLILDENFDNVGVDVQAVSSPSFVQANKEHDEDKKEFEDAIKENEKLAKETIPKEGSTGKKVTSPALKKMHLSEELFTEASNSGLREKVKEFVIDTIYEALDNLVMVVNSKFPEYDPDWFNDDIDYEVQTIGKQVQALANVIVNGLFKDAINESINLSNRDEFTRRIWSFLYDMMTDFDASYDDIYQEVRKFCDEGPLIDFDESLNESVNEEDLEIRLINYIKKFQKHYNIDAASMSKVLAAVGKSIELLNPVNESLKEDLDEGDYDDLKSDVYNALADVVSKYHWKGISQAEVEKAIEWFEIKFFEDEFEEGLIESLEGDKKSNLESEIYQSLERIATKYDKFDDFTFDDMEEAITAAFDLLANDFGLIESLEYQIAREQIKRFNEGKMSKNWNPETYLENLVKNNHITKTEATRLTESLLLESDGKFELQAWCCDGNNFARYREPMYWRKVGVYDTEEEAMNFVDKARKVSRKHEGDGSVQIIKYGSRWNSCVWSDIVGH